MDFVEVWGPPTSVAGRTVQIVFLSPLLGAIPLAIAGRALLGLRRRRRSDAWVGVSRIGVLLQVCGVFSNLVVGTLVLSELDFRKLLSELGGPFGLVLGFVGANVAAAVAGLQAWRGLGIASSRTSGNTGAG